MENSSGINSELFILLSDASFAMFVVSFFFLSEPLIARLVDRLPKPPKSSCKYIFAPKVFQSSKREVSRAVWLTRSGAGTASTQKMVAAGRL